MQFEAHYGRDLREEFHERKTGVNTRSPGRFDLAAQLAAPDLRSQ